MLRTVVTTVLAVLLLGVMGSPAWAHGRGSDATNFVSRITQTPDLPGLEWTVLNGDEFLRLENTSDREVVVLGYQDEPYLRIGPDGVFHNLNSQATYVNADRFGEVPIPPDLNPGADPEWEKISDDSTYAWHDHRIHWMAPGVPPSVTDPSREMLVLEGYEVRFEVDGERYEVVGNLFWVPPVNPWLWLAPAVVVLLGTLWPMRHSQPDVEAGTWPELSRPAGLVLGVIALANVLHLVDDFASNPLPFTTNLVAGVQTAFFIGVGLFGAYGAYRAREGSFVALGVGSASIFIGQGLLYWSALSASQAASVAPDLVARAVIALSIAQVVPLAIIAVLGSRRTLPEYDEEPAPAPAATADGVS